MDIYFGGLQDGSSICQKLQEGDNAFLLAAFLELEAVQVGVEDMLLLVYNSVELWEMMLSTQTAPGPGMNDANLMEWLLSFVLNYGAQSSWWALTLSVCHAMLPAKCLLPVAVW